jgi:GT2 family glycosyltransferase
LGVRVHSLSTHGSAVDERRMQSLIGSEAAPAGPAKPQARRPAGPAQREQADTLPAGFLAALEASRRRLLEAVGDAADLTFVRGVGNLGDELIYAGTRRLLDGLPGRSWREIALDQLPVARGHTALLAGGGAWCRTYHDLMPQMLPQAELRFERVIVLPSSFDLDVPEVREALSRSKALIFAREGESYRQIRDVCTAELAHDCAFFFDYSPYRCGGRGELLAMRSDREAAGAVPAGNLDISLRCSSLDEWLWTIARHAAVVTDRAHVMIAAALLGKSVAWSPSNYHKLPALAEHSLGGFDVRRAPRRPAAGAAAPAGAPAATPPPVVDEPEAATAASPAIGAVGAPSLATGAAAAASLATGDPSAAVRARLLARANQGLALVRPDLLAGGGEPRLTVIVLTRDRPHHWSLLLRSLRSQVRLPYRLLLVDNDSAAPARAELRRLCEEIFPPAGGASTGPSGATAEIVWRAENLGCAAARRFAVERASTEYVMFLDDDAEVFPGTVEHLVQLLDAAPETLAAGGHIVLPDGRTWFCGGAYRQEPPGVLRCEPLGFGLDFDDAHVAPAGPCGWLAGCAVMVRRSAFLAEPLDLGMGAYYEDTEWSYRVGRLHPGAVFQCQPAALVLHHHELKGPRGSSPAEIFSALPFLQAIAHFYRVHGLILEGAFVFAPELVHADRWDAAAARLLLELLLARGPEWLGMEWLGGGLAPLFAGGAGASDGLVAANAESGAASLRVQLAQARADVAMHSHELAVVRGELVMARHELRAERDQTAAARRDLAAIHESRAWRLVRLYWRLREAVGRRLGGGARRPGGSQPA